MPKRQTSAPPASNVTTRLAQLSTDTPECGVAGPGQWLVADYAPVALFSLKVSLATSAVGRSLLVPTPYTIKMALVDAAFRAGFADDTCGDLLTSLIPVEVRISPPSRAIVTNTFLKVRQEPKTPEPLRPYISAIAYRELVFHAGPLRWAFDLASGGTRLTEQLVQLLPHVSYVGRRGSFVRFLGVRRVVGLDTMFTRPLDPDAVGPPLRFHAAPLDDFGPAATLEALSSYSKTRVRRDAHRRFVHTIVPLGCVNTGPGFSEWRRD